MKQDATIRLKNLHRIYTMHNVESYTALLWAVLGMIGGAVRVTAKLLITDPLPSMRSILWLMLANVFISGFAGFLGAIAATQISSNPNFHVIAASICGYLGVEGINLTIRFFKERTRP